MWRTYWKKPRISFMLLFNCWQRSLRRACESSVCRETTSSDNLRNTRRISSVWTVPRAHIALNSWNILGHCWGHSRLIISTKMREIASSVCRCACNRGMMSEPSAARSAMQDSLMKTFSSCEITYQRYLMQCSMSWIPENNQKYQVWKKLEKKKNNFEVCITISDMTDMCSFINCPHIYKHGQDWENCWNFSTLFLRQTKNFTTHLALLATTVQYIFSSILLHLFLILPVYSSFTQAPLQFCFLLHSITKSLSTSYFELVT